MKKQNDFDFKIRKEDFEIFQFVKLNPRQKDTAFTGFISSLWGRAVKDVTAVPYAAKDTGDVVKRFDAFRTTKKISVEEQMQYREFNLISNKTRQEIFGGETEIIRTYDTPPVTSEPARPKQVVEQKPVEEEIVHVHEDIQSRPTFVETEPIYEEPSNEFAIETFTRKPEAQKEIKVTSQPTTFETHKKTYQLPSVKMFSKQNRNTDEKPEWLLQHIEIINATLKEFGIEGYVHQTKKGPTVTRYEIALEPGVNVKRIVTIQDNLMMNLASKSIRIEAPIPGKTYVGIEVPNAQPEIVAFGNVVDDRIFIDDNDHPLKVALGVDIDGENIYVDIAKMPHGLIAGATNSGKSVCVNTILVSLLLKNKPEDLKLILIDPKMVELSIYNDLPHLITPVITDAKMASSALQWAVEEMERRYHLFAQCRSRDISSYNEQVKRGVYDGLEHMPYIVIVIDELADLMMVAAQDVEDSIQRLTQKARAAGIHLLVATQRPTTDVVKGTIKSNIPTRIAFKVASFVDSTTILDGAGAETLLGKGDMLLKDSNRALRLQGAYIKDREIEEVTDFIRNQAEPNYVFAHEDLRNQIKIRETITDELFGDVARYVVSANNASINSIQKQFEIGFNRAQKLMEMLEQYQIVSRGQGTKAREVLVSELSLEQLLEEINHG